MKILDQIKTFLLIAVCGLTSHLNAQDTNVDWNTASDDQVILEAIELTTPTPSNEVPDFATYYSAQHSPISAEPWPPMPENVNDFSAWDLGSNIWVLDDLGFDYGGLSASVNHSMMAMDDDDLLPPGSDSDTNYIYFPAINLAPFDPWTNLWIAQEAVSGANFTGILINTIPGLEYQLLSMDSLNCTQWVYQGEPLVATTNWVPWSLPYDPTTNFFLNALSLQDDGSGLPIWWQLKYFGATGVNPDALDPAGDGWTDYQKFAMGISPSVWVPPPPPPGASIFYDNNNQTVTLTWQPSPGNVTGYTVTRIVPPFTSYTFPTLSATATNFVDTSPVTNFPPEQGEPYYFLQANYALGSSEFDWLNMFDPYTTVSAQILAGTSSNENLTITTPIPPGTSGLHLIRSYLTNSLTAESQTDPLSCPYIGRIGPGSNLVVNASTFANNWAGNYFIWCGVSNGTGGLNLTISDPNGNLIAQTTAYIQIVDIKQMYERWTVGDQPSIPPTNNAALSTEGLAAGETAFRYPASQNTNTPYILYVHGWNMSAYDKDRFAESAFKRLYWQGYHGRFGEFRWPTDYDFNATLIDAILQPHNYDGSENQAWNSALGLMNKLNDLNTQYPGQVYVLAHSMGNVVTGEALRLAAQNGLGQIVNTYVGSQAAIPAHVYDASVTSPYLIDYNFSDYGDSGPGAPRTPNIYGNRLTNTVAAVGTRISFYNTNDYALAADAWCFDQEHKPDINILLGGGYEWDYGYSGNTNDPPPWNNFFRIAVGTSSEIPLNIVGNASTNNLYEVLAYAANPYSTALGATPTVSTLTRNVDMTSPANNIWPSPDPLNNEYKSHFWHSAQFRGDAPWEWNYWQTLLRSPTMGFNITN